MADITHAAILAEIRELRSETQSGFDKLNGRTRENEQEIAALKECAAGLRRDVDRNSAVDKVFAAVSAVGAGIAAIFVKQIGG